MTTKFHILTPAFNCETEIISTLYSVAGQTYQDWSMTIVDDMCTDKTVHTIEDFVNRNRLEDKISILSRQEKYGEVRNTLDVCSRLDDDTVVVRLDAGDWLTDLGCLQILDFIYQQYDPAVAWTMHRWSFTQQNISGPIDPDASIYEQPWKSSHLKTFRNNALLGLNPQNFKDEVGDYITIACDQAIFLPMMERMRRKGKVLLFLPQVMYHYNIALEDPEIFHCERSQKQKLSAEWIRKRGYIE